MTSQTNQASEIVPGTCMQACELQVTAENEACAKLMELSPSEIRLMAGELTAQEMRTVQAVLTNRAAVIRRRLTEKILIHRKNP